MTDPVTTRADLDVSKTATPNPVVNGQNATYTITVRNTGPSVSRSVVVSDPVPAPLTYVSSSSTQGTCTQGAGTVTCAVGDLALNATATITVVAAVPSAGGANGVTNTATATSSTTDPVTTNNSASYQLQTGASANIVMSKTATATVTAGQAVTFNLTARNDGPSDAQGVTITDSVPASVTGVIASTTTPGAACAVTGNAVTCSDAHPRQRREPRGHGDRHGGAGHPRRQPRQLGLGHRHHPGRPDPVRQHGYLDQPGADPRRRVGRQDRPRHRHRR